MIEIWKDIPGYEGYYQASNLGRIKSLDKLSQDGRNLKEKLIKLTVTRNGYQRIRLRRDGSKNSIFVHRLIALTFIPNVNNLPVINHKDGNKLNNKVENLEWVSQRDNILHALRTGLTRILKGEDHPRAHMTEEKVVAIRNMYKETTKTGKEVAEYFGLPYSLVKDIINKRSWSHII